MINGFNSESRHLNITENVVIVVVIVVVVVRTSVCLGVGGWRVWGWACSNVNEEVLLWRIGHGVYHVWTTRKGSLHKAKLLLILRCVVLPRSRVWAFVYAVVCMCVCVRAREYARVCVLIFHYY